MWSDGEAAAEYADWRLEIGEESFSIHRMVCAPASEFLRRDFASTAAPVTMLSSLRPALRAAVPAALDQFYGKGLDLHGMKLAQLVGLFALATKLEAPDLEKLVLQRIRGLLEVLGEREEQANCALELQVLALDIRVPRVAELSLAALAGRLDLVPCKTLASTLPALQLGLLVHHEALQLRRAEFVPELIAAAVKAHDMSATELVGLCESPGGHQVRIEKSVHAFPILCTAQRLLDVIGEALPGIGSALRKIAASTEATTLAAFSDVELDAADLVRFQLEETIGLLSSEHLRVKSEDDVLAFATAFIAAAQLPLTSQEARAVLSCVKLSELSLEATVSSFSGGIFDTESIAIAQICRRAADASKTFNLRELLKEMRKEELLSVMEPRLA